MTRGKVHFGWLTENVDEMGRTYLIGQFGPNFMTAFREGETHSGKARWRLTLSEPTAKQMESRRQMAARRRDGIETVGGKD